MGVFLQVDLMRSAAGGRPIEIADDASHRAGTSHRARIIARRAFKAADGKEAKKQSFISRQKIYSLALGYSVKGNQSGLAMQPGFRIRRHDKVSRRAGDC